MKPTVLIVDDFADMVTFLKGKLSTTYTVLTADSASAAMEILVKEVVNLIISDVMMPDIDGFDFCKTIKSTFDTCHIPIILLTAKEGLESKINGLECGADAYIEKPFSPKYLQAQISTLLSNRNKIKDFFAISPLAMVKSVAYVKSDEIFLDHLNTVIQKNLKNPNFDIEQLAKEVNMSRATLFRKTKGITNLTPHEFIIISRLKKAASLLSEDRYKIFEIAYMVGFTSQNSFARTFLKQFKMTPTEFVTRYKSNEAAT